VAFKGVRWRFLLGFRLAEKLVISTFSQYMRKKCVSDGGKLVSLVVVRLGKKDGA